MIAKEQIALLILMVSVTIGQTAPGRSVPPKADSRKWELAKGVVETLWHEQRGGSLIYRGKCTSESNIADIYLMDSPVTTVPLDQALNEISRKYPALKWIDFGQNGVRVIDASARVDVLNLRVKKFRLEEVANPNLAVSAIWNIPEIKSFADANHITFVLNASGIVPPQGTYTRISIDVEDASVAEILDQISRSYRQISDPTWRSVWVYHECEMRGQMVVEFKVM